MNNMHREIEKKYYVGNGLTQNDVDHLLRMWLRPSKEVYGNSTDYYFDVNGKADFLRLRVYNDSHTELTIKTKDQASNFNRLEVNLESGSEENAQVLCTHLFGKAIGSITKQYSVFWPSFAPDTVVSTYTVPGIERPILEVEAPSEGEVLAMTKILNAELALIEEPNSLYELVIKPSLPVKWSDILGYGC
jgi:CYTH domain-containing protein